MDNTEAMKVLEDMDTHLVEHGMVGEQHSVQERFYKKKQALSLAIQALGENETLKAEAKLGNIPYKEAIRLQEENAELRAEKALEEDDDCVSTCAEVAELKAEQDRLHNSIIPMVARLYERVIEAEQALKRESRGSMARRIEMQQEEIEKLKPLPTLAELERFLKNYKELECIDECYLERLATAILDLLKGER